MKKFLVGLLGFILSANLVFACPEADQKKRLGFMKKFIAAGFFKKIEVPDIWVNIWVTPAWKNLDFDQKELSSGIVRDYYKCDNKNITRAVIFDSKTGKEIGTYSDYGFKLD